MLLFCLVVGIMAAAAVQDGLRYLTVRQSDLGRFIAGQEALFEPPQPGSDDQPSGRKTVLAHIELIGRFEGKRQHRRAAMIENSGPNLKGRFPIDNAVGHLAFVEQFTARLIDLHR